MCLVASTMVLGPVPTLLDGSGRAHAPKVQGKTFPIIDPDRRREPTAAQSATP